MYTDNPAAETCKTKTAEKERNTRYIVSILFNKYLMVRLLSI